MTRRWIVAAALLVATSVLEAQQLPPGKWWRRDEVGRQLSLNAEQQNRLDTIFRDASGALIDARGEVEKASILLRSELDSNQLDRAAIQKLAARVTDARGKLFERELMMLVDMRAVLTEPQWARMRNFLDRMNQDRPNQQRRPDGPGPNGPNPGKRNPVQRPRPG
jgi:Spy/CpxP family protein refolding chaperone